MVLLVQVSLSNFKRCKMFQGILVQPVDVMPLVQAVYNVLIQLVNVLAILDTLEPLVTPVLQITTEQVAELVQVSLLNFQV